MKKHEQVNCHLCGEDFTCAMTRGWMCACAEVELTPGQSEKIQALTGGTCVCNACLIRLSSSITL